MMFELYRNGFLYFLLLDYMLIFCTFFKAFINFTNLLRSTILIPLINNILLRISPYIFISITFFLFIIFIIFWYDRVHDVDIRWYKIIDGELIDIFLLLFLIDIDGIVNMILLNFIICIFLDFKIFFQYF